MLFRYGPATLELAIYALIVAFIVGIPLGMLAAYLRDRWPDAILRIFAILFYATPVFFAGLRAQAGLRGLARTGSRRPAAPAPATRCCSITSTTRPAST